MGIKTYEEIADLLSLVDVKVSPETIKTWTLKQQREVETWAAKTYLKASDNNVRVPSKPIIIASIEDLKQNSHVQGLLEIIDIYGNELDWDGVNNPAYIQDRGKRARQKLEEWNNE